MSHLRAIGSLPPDPPPPIQACMYATGGQTVILPCRIKTLERYSTPKIIWLTSEKPMSNRVMTVIMKATKIKTTVV